VTLEKTTRPKPPAAEMTRDQAMYLLKTIYPTAPVPEILKAAILCAQYHLNPLMRQVYLIPFNKKGGGLDWVIVIGIKATRQIAGAHKRYTYKDGPRVMTKDEQITILGQPDETRTWAITVLKDEQGNEYPGYGFWHLGDTIYGADKGNSETNMAFIRSERNALDKLCPGVLPDVGIGEELYAPVNVPQALAEGERQHLAQVEQDIIDLYGMPGT